MRGLFLVLVLLMALYGCSSEAREDEGSNKVDANNAKVAEEIVSPQKKLGFNTQDVLKIEELKEDAQLKTYDLADGMKIDVMRNKYATLTFFTYYLEDSDYPSAFFIRNTGKKSNVTFENLEIFYSRYSDEEKKVIQVLEDETEDYHLAGLIYNEEIHHSDLPFSLVDISDDDFFVKGIDKDEFNKINGLADYEKLLNIANKYIEDNDPKEHDSVYDVLEVLEPIQNKLGDVKVVKDEFDGSAAIYYKDLVDVGMNDYIVPFINTNERYMDILVGFEKDGWLFADKYTFDIDGELHTDSNPDFKRDTLGGSKIRETYISPYKEEVVKSIINGKDVKLRFEGKNGKLDYVLSDRDKKAIETISLFNEVHHDLSDLIFRFYK